ncbi:MAG TPA: GMC family oxidoreductase [Vicinamibacterales bacterium]|nr:GMC family oxidoreductase [Vicinamibacterales bacterium]
MQNDKTISIGLGDITRESRRLAMTITPKTGKWDVIVVGSGAAGGMAAFQLAMAGIKVLVLEAGRMIDTQKEYRTMEWPYASMRRHRMPTDERSIGVAEYNFVDRPYGNHPGFEKYRKLNSYAGNTFTRNWVVNEKENPTTGTPYAGVRARILGGRTNFWGRGALRYGPLEFKAASHDGFDVDWPISYDDVKPYYDKVDILLGCSGTKENLTQVPDGIFQRPSKLNCVEVEFKRAIAKMGRHYIPGRAGVTTEGVLNNKYRTRCMGRGRCGRGCDLHSSFHSPTALIYPARDSGNLTVRPYSIVKEVLLDEGTNRASGVRVIDANTREVMDFKARVVVLGAGALETTRILFNSKSPRYPNGMGNSSGIMGSYLSEHMMGIRGSGFMPTRIGKEPTLDDGRPVPPYIPRFRNVTDRQKDFIRGYHFQGGGGSGEYPGMANQMPGYGKALKSSIRKYYPSMISLGGFGEVLPRKENRIMLDPQVTDAWGIPVLKFDFKFGDNEMKMAKDMAATVEEMLTAAGAESIKVVNDPLPPGWSIHEIGTARMGDDPKASVTDKYCRLHDVKNVYLADASPFVSGGTQNTTWSILAMCWRTMDYLKEQMKAGDA